MPLRDFFAPLLYLTFWFNTFVGLRASAAPAGKPDVVCAARMLTMLPRAEYDSVYCSHNLEHYYRHDAYKVLSGFLHVLREDGFAFIRVPDMEELMKIVTDSNLDIDGWR